MKRIGGGPCTATYSTSPRSALSHSSDAHSNFGGATTSAQFCIAKTSARCLHGDVVFLPNVSQRPEGGVTVSSDPKISGGYWEQRCLRGTGRLASNLS